MDQIIDFFENLGNSEAFMPRWLCGQWSPFHGWLYIISDLIIFLAYMAIPIAIFYFIRKKWGSIPFAWVLWLFIAFIALCGVSHFVDAFIFWVPVYRLNALVLVATALVSMATVVGLIKVIPLALEFKSPAEVVKSEQKFRGLLESAPDAMVIVNMEGVVSLINAQAERIFGYSRDEMIGKSVDILIPDSFRVNHKAHRDTFFKNPKVRPMGAGRELSGKRKDGTEFPVEISLSPLEIADETLVSAAIRDISDRKAQQDELMKAREMAAKSEELERFAHITAHNIRSPASNLSSLTKLLLDEKDPEEVKKLDHLIHDNVEVLMRTLDDVSEILSASNSQIKPEIVVFEEVYKDVMLEMSEKILESKTQIITDFSKAHSVMYPREHVHSILLNLVSNAIRYRDTTRGNKIRIKTYLDKGFVLMSVLDNGLGIDLSLYEKSIFKLYKTFHKNPESKGVGLFLIKNQLASLGGDIEVSSKVGAGTEFIVTFGKIELNK